MAEITKVALKVDNNSSFPNNNAGAITPTILRAFNTNMIDSLVDEIGYTADSSSWNAQFATVGGITGSFATTGSNTFRGANNFTSISASSFVSGTFFVGDGSKLTNIPGAVPLTSLNAFTASQETKDTTLATYTASVDTKFTAVGASTSSLNTFTGSQDTKNTTLATYTGSNDTKWSTLGGQTGSFVTETESGSFLITASVSLNTITFTKGNNTTFAVTVNTGSGGGGATDISSLNAFTASQDTKNSTLATYTASVDTKFVAVGASTSSLNTATASLFTSASLSLTTASFSGNTLTFRKGDGTTFGIVLPDVSGSTIPTGTISGSQQITALGFVSSSVTASSLITASVSLNTITFTKGDASTFNITVNTGSATSTDITALNSFTASQETKNTTLASVTSSLNTATASLFTSTSLSLTTASFAGNTLTFTKGDTTTFGIVLPDVSGSTINTGSFATTGSNTFNGNQTITGSLTISSSANFDLIITGSAKLVSQDALSQLTMSPSSFNVNSTKTVATGAEGFIFGSTGSNAQFYLGVYDDPNFNTDVELNIAVATGSGIVFKDYDNVTAVDYIPFMSVAPNLGNNPAPLMTRGLQVTGSTQIQNFTASLQQGYAWVGNSSNVSTLVATSSFGTSINTGSFVTTSSFNTYTASVTESVVTAVVTNNGSSNYIIDGVNQPKLSFVPGPKYRFDLSGIVGSHPFKFSTTSNGPTEYTTGVTSGSNFIQIEVGYDTTTPLYYYCTNHNGMGNEINVLGIDKLVTTASFNAYTASQSTVNTGSLMRTGSVSGNVLTFTKGDATTFTLTVATGSGGGGGAAFPYTGSAEITGSLGITGSFRGFVNALSVASSTASIDMNNGNFFTLNLPTSSTTHITMTNIKAGQTINLQVSQSSANTGSIVFAPNIKFAGGFDYTTTPITGALDLVSFITFDTVSIIATSVKNLL